MDKPENCRKCNGHAVIVWVNGGYRVWCEMCGSITPWAERKSEALELWKTGVVLNARSRH